MRIRSIRVENFRSLEAVSVELAQDGVTIIEAPNEAGKSSLFEALDIVLAYKDNSNAAKLRAVRPVGGQDQSTLVEVCFSFGDLDVRFEKRFFKDKGTLLELRGRVHRDYKGAAAHDQMLAVFAQEVDEALYKALRFRQGDDLLAPKLGASASLVRALDQSAGGDAQLDGGSLFERIEAEYSRYWSKGTEPKPKKLINAASQVAAAAHERLAEVEGRVAGLEHDADQCIKLAHALDTHRAALATAKPELAEVSTRLAAVARHREAVAKHDLEAQQVEVKLQSADRALDTRAQLAQQAHTAAVVAAEALEAQQLASAALEGLERDDKQGAVSLEELKHARKQAADAATIAGAQADHARLNARRHGLLADAQANAKIEARAETIENELAGLRIDDAQLASLRDAVEAHARAQAIFESGAPQVRLRGGKSLDQPEHPDAGASLELDGTVHPLVAGLTIEQTMASALVLELPGTLSLEVRVQGAMRDASQQRDEALTQLTEVREAVGFAQVADAEAALRQRRELVHELRSCTQQLEAARARQAGDGAANLAKIERRLAALEQDLPSLATSASTAPGGAAQPGEGGQVDALEAAAAQCAEALAALDEELQTREAAAHARNQGREAARERVAAARSRHELRQQDAQRDAAALEQARAHSSDAQLAEARAEVDVAHRNAIQGLHAASALLESERPEFLEARASNLNARIERTQLELRADDRELHGLREAIRSVGDDGLGERHAAAEIEVEHADAALRALQARADAARMLYEVMTQAREAQTLRYRAPLQNQISALGRIIWGHGFEVQLDDELAVSSRILDGQRLPFESLSAGAREQLGIVAALAAAKLTAADGVPVILDDSLGYADPERLGRMGAVLDLAGQDGQVIVLTCMPGRFSAVGHARVLRLESKQT